MRLSLYLAISAAIAAVVTFISLLYGVLVAPGVFYTMGGGFFGVTWPPKTEYYVLRVFASYFAASFAACYFTALFQQKGKNNVQ
jgi:hypothetical protein